jgi:hypothetical protein
MEIKVLCKETIEEDGAVLFIQGNIYEAYKNSDNHIDGRSEIDQYVTISDSGNFKFEDFFEVLED